MADSREEEDGGGMTFLRVVSNPTEEALLEDDLTTSLVPPSPPQPKSTTTRCQEYVGRVGSWLGYVSLVVMLIVIPVVIYHAAALKRADLAAFRSAEAMVLVTLVWSARLIYLHLTNWYMPDVQKYVVRILWMVPLYAVQSWLGLRFHGARIYIDTVRDLYEAYVISSFFYYLLALLGGPDAVVTVLSRHPPDPHPFPMNIIVSPWEPGLECMMQCKHGVLQYVVVRTMTTLLTFFLQAVGLYGEGRFSWNVAYPYLALILNTSVMYALYCLVKFFHAVHYELCHPINWRPLGKFLCVKGVVFFTWWQGVVIFYLESHGIIGGINAMSPQQVAFGLIDYCICVEMVFFAMAHTYTFTHKEYMPTTEEEEEEVGDPTDTNYRPPLVQSTPPPIRTLSRPMRFRDAFWSSTVPEETLHDIQRFRQGVDHVVTQATFPGEVSLGEVPSEQP